MGDEIIKKDWSDTVVSIDSQSILYPTWSNDECYTPAYWVKPIIKYINKYKKQFFVLEDDDFEYSNYYEVWKTYKVDRVFDKTVLVYVPSQWDSWTIPKKNWMLIQTKNIIWCPFDKEDSQFVIQLKEEWYDVVHSHIDEWKDFYKYEPEKRDILISNPPFTNKRKIFERALSFEKPFALLMSNTWLNDSAPKQLFYDKDLQLLMFDKRIEYNQWKKITFSSSYYCWNLLPKQIICEKLIKT